MSSQEQISAEEAQTQAQAQANANANGFSLLGIVKQILDVIIEHSEFI